MGFQDAFGKSGGGEGNLQYDDGAFYVFLFTTGFFVLLFQIYSLIKTFKNKKAFRRNCKCKDCLQKQIQYYKSTKYDFANKWLYLQIFLIILTFSILVFSQQKITNIQTIKSFDPYEILEVSPSDELPVVKKSYRQLTIKYHPDKNQNDPQAAAKFILIAKAYEVLTDEKAKKNYEKYGSPDGPGSMQVSIAMPSFLLNKDNHVYVLAAFFILILILVPSCLFIWFNTFQKYDQDGVSYENKKRYFQQLNENTIILMVPQILATSEEFETPTSSEQQKSLNEIYSEINTILDISKIPKNIQKPLILIIAYLRKIEIPQNLKKDMNLILKLGPKMLDAQIDIAMIFKNRNKNVPKYIGFKTMMHILHFKQCFIQGQWFQEAPLGQLKFYNDDQLKKFFQRFPTAPGLIQLQNMPEELQAKFYSMYNDEEKKEIQTQLSNIPKSQCEMLCFVKGEQGIHVNDTVTFKFTFKRASNLINNKAQLVHSLRYPYPKKENWHFVLYVEQSDYVVHYQKITSQKNSFTVETKMPLQQAGFYNWKIILKSDSYRSLDQVMDLKFECKPERQIEPFKYHQEDLDLDKVKSIFQTMQEAAQQQMDQNSDEEIEDDASSEGEKEIK